MRRIPQIFLWSPFEEDVAQGCRFLEYAVDVKLLLEITEQLPRMRMVWGIKGSGVVYL